MADVVWGVGVEPKCLTDRTQMCFTIIPFQGAQGDRQVASRVDTQVSRQPKGRRDIVRTHREGVKNESR